jgi:predicted metal-dependent hydrolase
LQLAVALYHLGNNNWRGTVTLLGEGVSRLSRYPEIYAEIEVDQLVHDATALLKLLQQEGAEQVDQIRQELEYDSFPVSQSQTQPVRPRPKLPKIQLHNS